MIVPQNLNGEMEELHCRFEGLVILGKILTALYSI